MLALKSEITRSPIEPLEPRRLLAVPVGLASLVMDRSDVLAHPTQNFVYLSDTQSRLVRVIDTTKGKQIARIAFNAEPGPMAVSGDGTTLLVGLDSEQVARVSLSTLKELDRFPVGGTPDRLATARGDTLFVSYHTEYFRTLIQPFDATTGVPRGGILSISDLADPVAFTDRSGSLLYAVDPYSVRPILEFSVSDTGIATQVRKLSNAKDRSSDLEIDKSARRLFSWDYYSHRLAVISLDGQPRQLIRAPEDDGHWTGIGGTEGSGLVFATYATETSQSLYSINTTTLAVTKVTDLLGSEITEVDSTVNGRSIYLAEDAVGIVGSSTLTLPDGIVTVSGKAFFDLNGDGARQNGENWFATEGFDSPTNVTIYADLNNNGFRDDDFYDSSKDEPFVELTSAGTYSFSINQLGPVTIRTSYPIPYGGSSYSVFAPHRTIDIEEEGQQFINEDFAFRKGGTVRGRLFIDQNGSGVQDETETTTQNAIAYVDLNNDGLYQDNEPSAKVGDVQNWGEYEFPFQYELPVPPGSSVVRIKTDGAAPLTIAPAYVTASAGQSLKAHFGIVPDMVLTGTIYHDADRNRKRRGEEGLAGVRVWIDLSRNGKYDSGEPSALTDSAGIYRIATANRTMLVGGNIYFRTSPTTLLSTTAKSRFISFESLQQTKTISFGIAPSSIRARVIYDWNGSKAFEKGERGTPGVIVYLDLDNDGRQDASERFAITDADGYVTFDGVPPGEYIVRARISSKWTLTTRADFGVSMNPFQTATFVFGIR